MNGLGNMDVHINDNNNKCDKEKKSDTENKAFENTAVVKTTTDMSTSNILKHKNGFRCKLCHVPLTSTKVIQKHIAGRKHSAKIKNIGSNFKEQKFTCDICQIKVNGEVQLKQHLAGNKHKYFVEERKEKFTLKHYVGGFAIVAMMFIIITCSFYILLKFLI